MSRTRRLAVSAVVLLLIGAAPAAAAEYRWTADLRAFSYIKTVCNGGEGGYTVTEVVTQEILHRGSGVSHVGDGRSLPRGSSQSSGRIRRSYSKVVQGPDPAPPQDWTVTESLPLVAANWGAVNRSGKKLSIDVGFTDEAPRFGALKKGKSITITINERSNDPPTDDGRCVGESHGTVKGTVTITRVR